MKNRDGLENSNDWETPDWLYSDLNKLYNFDFDPCPINPAFDGLSPDTKWGKSNFVNPPYDRVKKPAFISRSVLEWQNGSICVLLIPAATSTKQFHKDLFPGALCISWKKFIANIDSERIRQQTKIIVFFEGRLAFKGYNTKGEYTEKNKGKHDSMLVILKRAGI